MVRDHGIETIGTQSIVPRVKFEILLGDDHVQETFLRAYGAIALDCLEVSDGYTKPNGSTVAFPREGFCNSHGLWYTRAYGEMAMCDACLEFGMWHVQRSVRQWSAGNGRGTIWKGHCF